MQPEAQNAIQVHDDMRIPIRDGLTLSARVWMPAAAMATGLPAILEILPYRKRDGTAARDATTHAQFARHDYVCLRVDLQGCGDSDGLFDDEYSEQELTDICDVITWISQQSWCSGRVGIMGISWGGFNGLQVAARNPTGLAAVISLCSSVDRFADDIHYKGGCQLTEQVGWAATATSWFSMPPDPDLVGENWRDIWRARLDNTPFLLSRWLRHPTRDAYWEHGSVCEDFSQLTIPILSIGGWHDGYRNTPAKLLEGHTAGPVKAIIGPWNHKYPHIAMPEPKMDFVTEALRWWDHWLKDRPTGVDTDPDCRLYLMDGIAPQTKYDHRPGRWIALPKWPSPDISIQEFALGSGVLGSNPMTQSVTIGSDVRCGENFGEFFPFGFGPGELPDDQRPDDSRSACFDTAPLPAPCSIVGAARATIVVAADTHYAQMTLRLCDVAPDGSSTLISLGLLNLQFRDGFDVAQALSPGQFYDVTIDLDQAAYVLPQGHRLRLAISPSYWPFIWPEAGPSLLTIKAGQLDLPVLTDRAGQDWDCPELTDSPEPVTKILRKGVESKRVNTQGQQRQLIIHADHGEVENLEHGLRNSSEILETWSIDHDDIARADAEIIWNRSMKRNDFSASTKVTTKMAGDSTAFYVTVRVMAYEGETCIFEKEYTDRVSRDVTSNRHINQP